MPARIVQGIEELRTLIGQEVGLSDWFVVGQTRINEFAEITEDRNWIHLDQARAKAELPAGSTIAHGFLTLSLMSYLFRQAVQVRTNFTQTINYGLNRLRFVSPVPAESQIRARCKLLAVEDVAHNGVEMCWNISIEREGQSKPVLVAEWLVRMY
jgi:acyl dehydratase